MKLVIQSGSQPGQPFSITKDVFSVGRGADNDLVLPDAAVSRRHFQIRREGGTLMLHDLDSANGTRVNQVRITEPRTLRVGDVITIGSTTLRVEEGEPETIPGAGALQGIPGSAMPAKSGKPDTLLWIALGGIAILCLLGVVVMLLVVQSTAGTTVSIPAPTQAAPTLAPAVASSPSALPSPTQAMTEGIRITSANAVSVTAIITPTGRGPMNRIAWSPDQKQLALASSYGVYLYDADHLDQTPHFITTTAWVWDVAYSPDSQLVACGGDKILLLFRANDGTPVAGFNPELSAQMINSVVFSPDGKSIAFAGDDKVIRLIDTTTGNLEKKFEGHTQPIRQIAFSPDGALLASASDDTTIRLWDINAGTQVAELRGHTGPVLSVAFNNDGTQLVSGGSDSFARVWQVQSHTLVRELRGHIELVLSVAFSPDNKWIVTGSGDRTIRIWNAPNGQFDRELTSATKMTNWVWGLAFNRDGTKLAASNWDGVIREWQVNGWSAAGESGKDKDSLHTHDFQSIAFTPVVTDSTFFATGSDDGAVRLWHIANWNTRDEKLEALDMSPLYSSWVDGVSFSQDGRWLASAARDNTLRLWKVDNKKLETQGLYTASNWFRSVAFSPTDNLLLASGNWQTLQLWRVGADDQLASVGGMFPPPASWVRSIAFSQFTPDPTIPTPVPLATAKCKIGVPGKGELMAAGGDDGRVYLWLAQAGKWNTVCDFQAHSSAVRALAFSAERNLLASAGEDNIIRLWRVNDGELMQELKGHNGSVNALAFSPDGTLLASGSRDKTIRLWRMRDGLMMKELTGHYQSVDSLAFSPDGKRLVSGSYDGTLVVWGIPPK